MPYIDQPARGPFGVSLALLSRDIADGCSPGELNYIFTRIAIAYMQTKALRYGYLNDVIGALEGAKLEFYRRIAAPYEDSKIASNGDVYPPGGAK